MQIKKEAIAGTLESNDIMITLSEGKGINIDLESSVKKQFGKQIEKVIRETLKSYDIKDANVKAVDKGALDYVIMARVKTAIGRACETDEMRWI
ncbi:citrate lyase acyl carrier protein [Peptoniphilus sp.]|uniref:citrate lyase acyl carrier protein n=1 Tax=Peptoniphilus sp. TaxID=1971214 RepID=UPI003D909FC3